MLPGPQGLSRSGTCTQMLLSLSRPICCCSIRLVMIRVWLRWGWRSEFGYHPIRVRLRLWLRLRGVMYRVTDRVTVAESPQSHTNHESHESLVTYRVTVAESLQRHSHESQSWVRPRPHTLRLYILYIRHRCLRFRHLENWRKIRAQMRGSMRRAILVCSAMRFH